jgi:cytochrome c nitrite reductase small subunit
MVKANVSFDETLEGNGKRCWDCHREVPHGSVRSLSATPWVEVPAPKSPVPDWLK